MSQKVPGARYAQNLTAAQRKAVEILATNDINQMTMAQVAETVGVSERTLYRWKQDPDFVGYQNELADHWMEDFLAEAYNILKGLTRKGRSEHVKLKALELVLKNRGKLTDVQKVEAKIEDTRSDEQIQAEIAELQRELEEIERTIILDREAQ